MLTPQEIQEVKFEKAMFGGYDMAQIDKFLDELLADYSLLYKENAALKAKMRVLVDKIDEYRAVDEEMRKALYNAQITAKEITDKAEQEAKIIIANAELEAKKKVQDIDLEIHGNALKLQEMRDICAGYAQSIKNLLNKAAEDITLTENKEVDEIINKAVAENAHKNKIIDFEIDIPDSIAVEPQPIVIEKDEVDEPTIEIDLSEDVSKPEEPADEDTNNNSDNNEKFFDITVIREQAIHEAEEPEDQEEEETTRKPLFNFSDLRFGKNYKNQD